jgi:hypothetical protein
MVTVAATAAGSTTDVNVNLVAPNAPGTYRGNWQIRSDEGVQFGSTIFVRIVVPAPVTDTPEPTEEPPSPPTNLQATLQPDGSVLFTWDDAVGEVMYEYEFSFVAGSLGAATADTLPADTTSWNGGMVDCGGSGSFARMAIAEGGGEIGGETVDFPTPACEPVTEDIVADADAFWWPDNMACITCPDFSTGTELELESNVTGNPPFQLLHSGRIALHFDLGTIPAGATVQEAVFYFYLNSSDGTTPVEVSVIGITSPWSEADHTVQPICDGTPGEPRNVGSGSGWYDWDVTDIVQGQYANPSTNYGLCLRGGSGDFERVFRSREGSAASRPYLRVTYQP